MYKFEPLTAVVLVDNNMGIGSGSDILFHCRPFREQQMRILANHPDVYKRQANWSRKKSLCSTEEKKNSASMRIRSPTLIL